jgi:hypothetical protein
VDFHCGKRAAGGGKLQSRFTPSARAAKNKVDFCGGLARFTAPFMKNDTTTTVMNFVLAALVILGVVFALLAMNRTRELRQMQTGLQIQMQRVQSGSIKVQALLNDVITYNTTAKSPELAQIIQAAQTPQQPAAK